MKKLIIAGLMIVSTQSSAGLLSLNSNSDKSKGDYHITCWHQNGVEYINKEILDFGSYGDAWQIQNLDDKIEYINSECLIEKHE